MENLIAKRGGRLYHKVEKGAASLLWWSRFLPYKTFLIWAMCSRAIVVTSNTDHNGFISLQPKSSLRLVCFHRTLICAMKKSKQGSEILWQAACVKSISSKSADRLRRYCTCTVRCGLKTKVPECDNRPCSRPSISSLIQLDSSKTVFLLISCCESIL